MPVRQIEDVPLALEDGNEKGCAEGIGVKKSAQLGPPVAQVPRDFVDSFSATGCGDWLN